MKNQRIYEHLPTGIIATEKSDGYLYYSRGGNREIIHERIPRIFVENSKDWVRVDVRNK